MQKETVMNAGLLIGGSGIVPMGIDLPLAESWNYIVPRRRSLAEISDDVMFLESRRAI
jgi:hypothetical protein